MNRRDSKNIYNMNGINAERFISFLKGGDCTVGVYNRVYQKKIILHFDDALGKKGCESWQRTSVIFFRFFG